MPETNCQQFELYASERAVPQGRTFATVEACQAYVDALRDTPLWIRQYSNVLRVDVEFIPRGSGSVGAFFEDRNSGKIEMLPCHRTELYVLHELAHVLSEARYGNHAHDPWFARTYLELVWTAMGPQAWAALHEAFEAGHIDHDHDSYVPAGIEMGGGQ